MSKEEFRANLYAAYVSSGMHDPVLTQEYIRIAENFIFNNQVFTITDSKNLVQKLSTPSSEYP